MEKNNKRTFRIKCAAAGALAGTANGLFGAGGGMFLVPLFTNWAKIDEKKAFATSVSVILPLCAVSAVIYFLNGSLDIQLAVPYLAGGLLGGLIGGITFKNTSFKLLRRIFGLLIIYGGVRSLL